MRKKTKRVAISLFFKDRRERNCEKTASYGKVYVRQTAGQTTGGAKALIPCATVGPHSRMHGGGMLLCHGDPAWQDGSRDPLGRGICDGTFAPAYGVPTEGEPAGFLDGEWNLWEYLSDVLSALLIG